LFVVGLSWRTAQVAVREKLAFREDELEDTLRALTGELPVAEALLVSTCNRVEVYGVAKPGADATTPVRAFLAARRGQPLASVADHIYAHRGTAAIRHVFRVAAALDSLVIGEAQILGQLKDAHAIAVVAGTSGSLLRRCLDRAFGAAKRVRTETAIAHGKANVSTVAVDIARRVFSDLHGKSVLVVGAGKMSRLAARHLYASGADKIIVTNRSPAKAEALADEIEGDAAPWEKLEALLQAADVVISSTGAPEPILTRALMKRVMKARKWKPMVIVDIAVPRDAEASIGELDGVYHYDIDALEKVVHANLSERERAAEQATKIVEHEVGQFEGWLRTQAVVPTIRALRGRLAQIAEAEVGKAREQLARKDLSPAQQRELLERTVELVINKVLHAPTTALREADADAASHMAAVVCELFGVVPLDGEGRESSPTIPPAVGGAAASETEPERPHDTP
jgi:glutamyl-tRNA reductase